MLKLLLLYLSFVWPDTSAAGATGITAPHPASEISESERLYKKLKLDDIVTFEAFDNALEGYNKIAGRRKDIITIIDFSKPSTCERLCVVDLSNEKLLYCSHVSHGQNSGGNYADSFSNRCGSHQSSLGFYLTASTYEGKNGYSLLLDGLEKGINDNARKRAIVVHGASYANPDIIYSAGRLGRSHGCPALPQAFSREIIDAIKDGSVIFIYAQDEDYVSHSRLLSHTTAGLHF
ncbi:murein L,D-transpeptidase catalytic domain family protein [uncultured Alistipes sp.]|jgi:hypothetical protein|uniref:murein L,D-transpeptidase catalytic domain family protein n=1 Tax=uncultured Alistipes sp. TaxID=538949 RepID=UPI0025FAF8E2|nr:murein L,D-transpeptidase catalytic domain family protein [uncultured Alistipes sp.]